MQSPFEQFGFLGPIRSRPVGRVISLTLGFVLLGASLLGAQQSSSTQSSDSQPSNSESPAPQKSPVLVDPTGPNISLQSSEALFDIAAALNSCGYDQGLAISDPMRARVRQEVNQALQASASARDAHDRVCAFIDRHHLSDPGLNLAQYVSLSLYTTAPPDLAQSVQGSDMPPDASQVEDILPLLRDFNKLADLHLIWLRNRPDNNQELARLHDSLTRMIVQTNAYLKLPLSNENGQRFLVVVEPLLDPRQTNARVYGADYVVVVSPVNGAIDMREVRHTYLHYEIEPLLYSRASTMNRLSPFLKTVEEAPLDYTYRSDIVALVVESMIRAIEARTMDTGVAIYNIPADIRRSDLAAATHEHNASVDRAEAVRQQAVHRSMTAGYVLTGYFYSAFASFEKEPQSFTQSIGEMVYGMDINAELSEVKNINFVAQAPADVVRRAPRQLQGLDLAEADLMKGGTDAAGALAQQALQDKSGDTARANFILARVAILHGDVAAAQHNFEETIRLSKDPRTVAWSHIYLGRIADVQNRREQALTEYHAALTTRDGQPDTKLAAEKGLKQAYAVPQQTHVEPADGNDPENQGGPSRPGQPSQPQ